MYCSSCGEHRSNQDPTCDSCGAEFPVPRIPAVTADAPGVEWPARSVALNRVAVCPRCEYHGQGLPFFSRGPHMAALVAATLFTLPFAMGAGGFLLYAARRDHRICPRCGERWGRFARRALPSRSRPTVKPEPGVPSAAGEGAMRVWSVLLLVLAAILVVVGIAGLEFLPIGLGLVAGGGGYALRRSASRAREERRAALIASLQTPVLKLAASSNGRLTVTEVAARLGWPLARAEKVLNSLEDGWRVSSEVTDEGIIVYEFRELLLTSEPPPETPEWTTDPPAQDLP
jgi:hypothetical protein